MPLIEIPRTNQSRVAQLSAWTFAFRDQTGKRIAENLNTNDLTKALRDHAPDMGCYLNEADVLEPNHQQAFWGDNYATLVSIKRKYDPLGVLWCSICVDSEGWSVDHSSGELCLSY
jgi:hypothetical protein